MHVGLFSYIAPAWRLSLLIAVFLCGYTAALIAQPLRVDIPEQPLPSALLVFSEQTGIQFFYRSDLVAGLHSTALVGEFDPATALSTLLSSSNLHYRFIGANTVTLFVVAQADAAEQNLEEVRVLGSHLRHGQDYDRAQPITVIDRAHIAAESPLQLTDVTQNLSYNSGAEVRVNNLSRPLTAGTAAINLRNLGLDSTMVLVDGNRVALSAVATTEGETFVDFNSLMPVIMLDNMQVLRGGASSTYGSDAVAGVVNLIPRYHFSGLELRGRYQQTESGDQVDQHVEALFGTRLWNDKANWVVAFSALDRDALGVAERSFSRRSAISSAGQPGTYQGSSGLIVDPACTEVDDNGFCLFDASDYFDLVPEEQRLQFFSTVEAAINNTDTLRFGLGYSKANIDLRASPSFPFSTELPVVPVDNPGNLSDEDLLFHGRLLGAEAGASYSQSNYRSLHSYLDFERDYDQWRLRVTANYSENTASYGRQDVVKSSFQAALNGADGVFWNPLYGANNPAGLSDSFFADFDMRGKSQLATIDVIANTDWQSFGDWQYALALGGHVRDEFFSHDFSQAFNNNEFYTLGGGPDFSGRRSVNSIFSELYLNWQDTVELQLSARHESYQGSLDTLSPALSGLWRLADDKLLRLSYSRAFRAPSLLQTVARQSFAQPVTDPLRPDSPAFRNVVTSGSTQIKPERADVYTLGFSFNNHHSLNHQFDVWYYDYRDLVVKESAQQLVEAALRGDLMAQNKVKRDAVSDEILRIDAEFINAASIVSSGIDWSSEYRWASARSSEWLIGINATYTASFDIKEQKNSASINAVGRRNKTTTAASTLPRWQGNAYLTWQSMQHQWHAVVRYVDSLKDDGNNNQPISSYTTADLHYKYQQPINDYRFSIGASLLNVFDRSPPAIKDFLGYDAIVHDPRGRMLSLFLQLDY